ncbi:MAG: L,D-transpeptidase family protein [Cellulomonas sp.]
MRSDRRGAAGAAGAFTVAIALLLAGCSSDLGQVFPGATPSDGVTTQPSATSSVTGGPTATPSASPSPSPSPSPTPDPTLDPTPDPTPAATTAPVVAPPPVVAPAPVPVAEPALLRRGDEGEVVAQVQRRLQELGYFLPAVDGRFGSNTQQAVWALQKAAGIGRDGVVGPETRAALDAGTRPTPRSTTGQALEVDLDTQLLLAVQDGQIVAIINASSGSGKAYEALGKPRTAHTPTGDFTVVRQIDGMHDSSLELGAMYRPKYFRGGFAIHGSPSIPPYPASHGCIRVSNDAINWIWDQFGTPIGTPILIHRS